MPLLELGVDAPLAKALSANRSLGESSLLPHASALVTSLFLSFSRLRSLWLIFAPDIQFARVGGLLAPGDVLAALAAALAALCDAAQAAQSAPLGADALVISLFVVL